MKDGCNGLTRRQWLAGAGVALGAASLGRGQGPASVPPVSIGKYASYDDDLVGRLAKQFDQAGGLGGLVRGKTVTVKLNLTGGGRFPGCTPGQTHWVHPKLVGACCYLFGKAGAKRVRLVEGTYEGESLQDKMLDGGWDVKAIQSAAPLVEFEETNTLGSGKRYSRLRVAKPYIFPAFDLNHTYEDTDVFVNLSKLKQHEECGITLSIKNMFGVAPNSIYGDDAGVDEPNENPRKGREHVLHLGRRQPSKSAPGEVNPASSRYEGHRVPRICVDLSAARPTDLAIVDGIETCVGGEGPWVKGSKHVQPGVVILGKNAVSTDTVATAVMGFDPRAKRGEGPFQVDYKSHPQMPGDPKQADNPMLLAEAAGLGSADLSRIEVAGVSIKDALFDFEKHRKG
ncbi:MAG TPA: DUF362 domain-containing protein [Bryobacteraceae bacterium]|nr:DUF362 domain-containing protein [Bryobacteraceae bacterium]